MKRKSARLQRIIVMAKSEERKIRQDMGRAQLVLDAEVNRLGELQSYRRHYDQKSFVGDGITPAHWADYQGFLSRLSHAVAEQEKHVLTGRENRDLHRKQWMAKRQRLDSLKRVIDRYRKAEDLQDERKQQKTLDDRPPTKNAFDT